MTRRHLLLVSGPSGGGKSTFIEQLRNGKLAPAIRSLLPAPSDGWPVVEANNVLKEDLSPVDFAQLVQAGNCLVHYDIVFIRKHGLRRYEDDPAMRLLAEAASLDVVFVRPDVAQLQTQFQERLQRQAATKSKGSKLWRLFIRRPLRRATAWLTGQPGLTTEAWYAQGQGLAACYREWESFLLSLAEKHPAMKILLVEPASRMGGPPTFRLSPNQDMTSSRPASHDPQDLLPQKSGRGSAHIRFDDLVRDKLVLLALARGRITPDCLHENGARDVLLLEKDGPAEAVRADNHVRRRYRRIPDVRKNNCQVAMLHGTSAFALMEKREFARFTHVLVPVGPALAAVLLGLLMYGRRKALVPAGRTEIACRGRRRLYLVLETHVHLHDQARQYGPAGRSPLELLQQLSGVDYVSLRGSEEMEAGTHRGDIDLLVSQDGRRDFLERFSREVGTYSFDVYTDDGQEGHAYKSVPYLTTRMARAVLQSAVVSEKGIRIPSPQWRYLVCCYHLLFHDKVVAAPPGASPIGPSAFRKPHYYQELKRLAEAAGKPMPRTFDDLEQSLREADVLPSLDLIGFYSNRNAFLKQRYFDQAPQKAGLVTFFVRDFGNGLAVVPKLRERLKNTFEVLAEGPVNDANRAHVLKGVRGGNWMDAKAPGGRADPVYWFVCWDHAPRSPSARTRRKHPRVDNENIRLKDELRRDLCETDQVQRVIHSSDNSMEALEHLCHLGLTDHPVIARRLGDCRQKAPDRSEA